MKFDAGRQQDLRDIEHAIRTSDNPKEIAAAKSAKQAILREAQNKKVVAARQWVANERAHGRHENVRNFLEDVEKGRIKT